MATQTRLFLCRHASPDNPGGVFYGHLDGFGLGSAGIAEAHGLGQMLAPEPIRVIYTSPLQRARETAEIVARHLSPGLPLGVRPDLVETRFGLYIQGIRRPEVLWRRPLFFVHYLAPGLLPADEPVGVLAARVGRACAEALAACRGEAAALVSHADPIKAFWNAHLGRPEWRFHQLRVDKGCCLELTYVDDHLDGVTYHPPRRADGDSNVIVPV
ncbi:MAG TPA: histidine phosphatase family protein [Candidatus Dormibacteraeota bacterium]|jgi:broad specificity phosphatase PhoE|nr:histidine phosphatase family protein [Candidatus Dormibacteraeota bacterium]